MKKFIIRKLSLILLISISCTPETENSLDYYISDSKTFLNYLLKNNITRSIEHFYIDNPATAERLEDDLALTRERIMCLDATEHTINFENFEVQDREEFNDNFPFFLRFSVQCNGRKKYLNIYYHPEHHKIYFVRDFFNEEKVGEGSE